MFIDIMMFCLLGIGAVAIYFLVRNERVYKKKMQMVDWVFSQPNWYELKHLCVIPSYFDMVFKFWVPVDSYYEEYLNPDETNT